MCLLLLRSQRPEAHPQGSGDTLAARVLSKACTALPMASRDCGLTKGLSQVFGLVGLPLWLLLRGKRPA